MSPYIAAFISPILGSILGFLSAYAVLRLNRSYSETKEGKAAAAIAAKEEAVNKQQWREGRIQAESKLAEDQKALWAALTKAQLSHDADMARVADIMKRFVDVSEQHTTMTEQMKWHGKTMERHDEEFKAVHEELKGIHNDIKDLLKRDA